MSHEREVRRAVRERYGEIARGERIGCGSSVTPEPTATACCGPEPTSAEAASCGCGTPTGSASEQLGYTQDQLRAVPEGADLGLGCGTPGRFANLRHGDVVVDLGSGGGLDCFLAAQEVGPEGRVIGVDMTPDMVERARAANEEAGYEQVEFRLGEIENLPIADATADVILSNCVVNLSPNKPRVAEEAFRVLRPGGRVAISDIVAIGEIPESVRRDLELHAACVAGASPVDEVERMFRNAGFENVKVTPTPVEAEGQFSGLASALIEATRPN